MSTKDHHYSATKMGDKAGQGRPSISNSIKRSFSRKSSNQSNKSSHRRTNTEMVASSKIKKLSQLNCVAKDLDCGKPALAKKENKL